MSDAVRPGSSAASGQVGAVPSPDLDGKVSGDRLVALYWYQLLQLKVHCEYMQLQQARLRRWVQAIAAVRAGASVGALGGWAVVRGYPILWGGIIPLAQVADAMQGAIPFNRHYQAANALVITLDALFIATLAEWEDTRGSGRYCKATCRDAHRGTAKAEAAPSAPRRSGVERECENCRNSFKVYPVRSGAVRPARWCSRACYDARLDVSGSRR